MKISHYLDAILFHAQKYVIHYDCSLNVTIVLILYIKQ